MALNKSDYDLLILDITIFYQVHLFNVKTLDLELLKICLGVILLFLAPAWDSYPAGPYPKPFTNLWGKANLYVTKPDLKEASIVLFSINLTSSSLPLSAADPLITKLVNISYSTTQFKIFWRRKCCRLMYFLYIPDKYHTHRMDYLTFGFRNEINFQLCTTNIKITIQFMLIFKYCLIFIYFLCKLIILKSRIFSLSEKVKNGLKTRKKIELLFRYMWYNFVNFVFFFVNQK